MSRFYIEHVQKARLYTDKTFHSLVSLQRLAIWGLSPEPSVEALAHEITICRREFSLSFLLLIYMFINIYFLKLTSFLLGMATMKENKGKEVGDEVVKQGVQSQPHPLTGEKRKNISSRVDLGDLPSRRGREKKHKSTKPQDVKSTPVSNQGSPVQILNLDSEPKDTPSKKVSSTVHAPTLSLPSKEVPQHLLGNEDLAWERFTMAVTDADVSACYNMSLRDFKHSSVHNLFKVSFFFFFFF